jgi:Excreted virulence factor EspC, type VII ESX diderm
VSVPEPGGAGVLRVTPDELRDGARMFETASKDISAQAGRLDSLFDSAAGGAGESGLASAMASASTDFSAFARKLSSHVGDQVGKLRGAASAYEQGDAAGAQRVISTPSGGPR